MPNEMTRRGFVKAGAAAAAMTALSSGRVYGANERIRLAFIGVGNRGSQLIEATLPNKDMEIVALSDVYRPYLDKWKAKLGGAPSTHKDFQEVLDRPDVDAVFVASPDHWHAIQAVMACNAGKHVYVEKPLSITIHEGRKMVEAARRNNRVVQVGVHRRASAMHRDLGEFLRGGGIGKITIASAHRLNNMSPNGIGKLKDSAPPADLDWDLWLGPRAERPFRENIAPYRFRWWQDYSSQFGNWGVHYFDTIRWLLGEEAPVSVSAHGGKFAVDDDRTIPDTMHATYEFASGCLLLFSQLEASGAPIFAHGAEIELRGTKGVIYAGQDEYRLVAETGGQFQDPAPRLEAKHVKSTDGDLTGQHIRNFLDCIKSGERPYADVEDGHRSTVFSHLGNIALATKSRIEWDPKAERITNNDEANKLLHYEYRKPWTLG